MVDTRLGYLECEKTEDAATLFFNTYSWLLEHIAVAIASPGVPVGRQSWRQGDTWVIHSCRRRPLRVCRVSLLVMHSARGNQERKLFG